MAEFVEALEAAFASFPAPVSSYMHVAGRCWVPRRDNIASHVVFPLPAWPHAMSGKKSEHRTQALLARRLANLWIGILNWLYAGEGWSPTQFAATCAQQRLLDRLLSNAAGFLRKAPVVTPGAEAIRTRLRADLDCYGLASRVALPLGTKCALPVEAARVDTAAVLEDYNPVVAEQCRDPSKLFRDGPLRVDQAVRPFSRLGPSYPELIATAEAAKLIEYALPEALPVIDGRLVHEGAFAVA